MTDPTDLELIDHSLGRGSTETRRQIDAQLSASPELRQRQAELTAMWDLLCEAEADLPAADLWPKVAEGLQYEPGGQKVLAGPWRLPYWARAAAAVVLATCVGYGSARARLGWGSEPTLTAPADDEIAEVI
ncbi:MAG: hypothetical protein GY844_34075, partial [Bradyrhizobium sp.]|nr:hypothetical protein [Bradyrhizobium sp.]